MIKFLNERREAAMNGGGGHVNPRNSFVEAAGRITVRLRRVFMGGAEIQSERVDRLMDRRFGSYVESIAEEQRRRLYGQEAGVECGMGECRKIETHSGETNSFERLTFFAPCLIIAAMCVFPMTRTGSALAMRSQLPCSMGGRVASSLFVTSLPSENDLERPPEGNPRARKDRHTTQFKPQKPLRKVDANRRRTRVRDLQLNGRQGSWTGDDDVETIIVCPYPNIDCKESEHLHKRTRTNKPPMAAAARRFLEKARQDGVKKKGTQFTKCPLPIAACGVASHYHCFTGEAEEKGEEESPMSDLISREVVEPLVIMFGQEKAIFEPVVPSNEEPVQAELSAQESKRVVEPKLAIAAIDSVVLPKGIKIDVDCSFGLFEKDQCYPMRAALDEKHVDQIPEASAPVMVTSSLPLAVATETKTCATSAVETEFKFEEALGSSAFDDFPEFGPPSTPTPRSSFFSKLRSAFTFRRKVHPMDESSELTELIEEKGGFAREAKARDPSPCRPVATPQPPPPPGPPPGAVAANPVAPAHPTREVVLYAKTGIKKDNGWWGDVKSSFFGLLPFVHATETLFVNEEKGSERSGLKLMNPATQTGHVFSFLRRSAGRKKQFRIDQSYPDFARLIGMGYDSSFSAVIFTDLYKYLISQGTEEGKLLQQRRPINRGSSHGEFNMNIGFIDAVFKYFSNWRFADAVWQEEASIAQDTMLYYIQQRMISAYYTLVCTPDEHKGLRFQRAARRSGTQVPTGRIGLGR